LRVSWLGILSLSHSFIVRGSRRHQSGGALSLSDSSKSSASTRHISRRSRL
jgi:hypothetical protein